MLNYYQKKMKEISYNAALGLEKNDPDGIHDLRVCLKNLNSLFNLVEALNLDFNAKKKFKAFRRIAKNTACIRDMQVQQKLLRKIIKSLSLDVTDYEQFLKSREAEGVKRFKKFLENNPMRCLDGYAKVIKKELKHITPVSAETKALGRFYNLRVNLIMLNSGTSLKEEILHKVRILSKEAHYTLEIIQQCFFLFGDRKDFIGEIKKVHQFLGSWHDYDVALVYLDEFVSGYPEAASSGSYRQLAQHMKSEKDALRTNFSTVFNEFTRIAAAF